MTAFSTDPAGLAQAVVRVRSVPDTFTAIRDTIRDTPRGPWQLSTTIGADRYFFEYRTTKTIASTLDFTESREALESLLLQVGGDALVLLGDVGALLDAVTRSLPTATANSPTELAVSLAVAETAAGPAASAVTKYRQVIAGYGDRIAAVTAGMSGVVAASKATALVGASGPSSGAVQLRDQVEALGASFAGAVATVTEQLTTTIPHEAAAVAEAIETVTSALGQSSALMQEAATASDAVAIDGVAKYWSSAFAMT